MKLHRCLFALALPAIAATALAQSNRVAVVNGEAITQEELDRAAAADLRNVETKRLQKDAELAQDKQQALARALEGLVADKLIESGGHVPEERRLITALFADVSGFTALADRLETEDLLEVIDPVISTLSAVVLATVRPGMGIEPSPNDKAAFETIRNDLATLGVDLLDWFLVDDPLIGSVCELVSGTWLWQGDEPSW